MDHKVSKDMISSGMIPSGEKTQADLGRTQYGSAPSPSSLMEAYRSIYEHHQKDKDGNTIPHQEDLNEGKMPEGLKNYLMKKGKKEDKKDVKEENLEERRGSSVQQLAANRKAAFTQKVAPQGGRGGGVGNPTNKRGSGVTGTFKFNKPTGAAQGRTRRPTSTPTPVKTSSMGGRVGGGNAGASTNSGGTTMSTVRTVTTSTPTTTTTSTPTPTPKPSVQQRAQSMAKDRIASGKSMSQVKASNKQSMRDRARDRFAAFKARRLMSDVDLFDIVKGQLIDEGYEEKEVIKIMINLSEDQLNELLGGIKGDGYIGHPNLKIKNPLSKQQIKKPVMPNAQGGGLLNRTAGQLGDRKMELSKN